MLSDCEELLLNDARFFPLSFKSLGLRLRYRYNVNTLKKLDGFFPNAIIHNIRTCIYTVQSK